MSRPAFVFDPNRCTGCRACELACEIANRLPAGGSWRRVHTFNELHVADVELTHLSVACHHCAVAPCLEQCPARAYRRDATTGAVLIVADRCVGCRYCAWVCPYDAPRFDETRGVMTKCTFCAERQHEGGAPACVTGCPTGALTWDELPDVERVVGVDGFASAPTYPAARVAPLRAERRVPRTWYPSALPPWRWLRTRLVPQISLAHEWTLAIFSWLAAVLVAIHGAAVVAATTADTTPSRPIGPIVLVLGVGGLLLSAAHLGRKPRAWRAALHADRSWLSREVVLFAAFLAAVGVPLIWSHAPLAVSWFGLGCGLGTLASMDLVYRFARVRGGTVVPSASVLLTGLLVTAALVGWIAVSVVVALFKVMFYGWRKARRRALGLAVRPLASVARFGLTLGGVAVLIGMSFEGRWIAVALLGLAELVDRAELYEELETTTPASLVLDALEARLDSCSPIPLSAKRPGGIGAPSRP